MIDSPLLRLVERRIQSLEEIDKASFPEDLVRTQCSETPQRPSLAQALKRQNSLNVLAEVKKKSPSAGELSQQSALEICSRYIDVGCHGISILMDYVHFNGHPKDMRDCVAKWPNSAFLFKDFVATEYQVYLAKALGASSILLMTQVLDHNELSHLFELSTSLGLEPFIEVHSTEQMKLALEFKPKIIGINARDFETEGMPVDLNTTPHVLKSCQVPEDCVLIAQSGIHSQEDIDQLDQACEGLRPDAIQIGSSLCKEQEALPNWFSNWINNSPRT